MKWLFPVLLSLSPVLADEGIQGEVWYDADGKVAYVEGPAATPGRERFVPAWERRARDRSSGRHEIRFHRSSYRGWYGYPGWSVYRPRVSRPHHPWHPCPTPRRGGVSIILR